MKPALEKKKKRIDVATTATVVVTVILFVMALIEKGFTHDLLLEAGVFLVSVKLILAAHQAHLANQSIEEKLDLLLERCKK